MGDVSALSVQFVHNELARVYEQSVLAESGTIVVAFSSQPKLIALGSYPNVDERIVFG